MPIEVGNDVIPGFHYSEAQRARFDEEGYLLFPQFLSPSGLERCRARCDEVIARCHPSRPTEMIISAHVQEPWLLALACQPALLDIVEAHVGPDIVLWGTHMLCKPPNHGRSIPWHQDAPYFTVRGRYAPTLWLAFDDIGPDNGGLRVLPGAHKLGMLPTIESGRTDFERTIGEGVLARANVEPFDYRLSAGQLAMHDALMPHYSPPNGSSRWRRVVTFSYVSADGDLQPKTYADYRTHEPFERQFILVRGRDRSGRGLVCARDLLHEAL